MINAGCHGEIAARRADRNSYSPSAHFDSFLADSCFFLDGRPVKVGGRAFELCSFWCSAAANW